MPVTQNFDDVDVFFKLNDDGESCRTTTVLGKAAYEKAIADGWTPVVDGRTGMRMLPKLPFPTGVYREIPGTPYGEFHRIENRAELNEAMRACDASCPDGCRKHGWDRVVRPAPPVVERDEEIVAPKTDASNAAVVELAMQLIDAKDRAAQQDKAIEELKAQNAAILELLRDKVPAKRPKGDTAA